MFLDYVGPIPSPGPDRMNSALPTRDTVMARLREIHTGMGDAKEILFAWGFDPAIQGGHLHRDELDRVSSQRPVATRSYAQHVIYTNSAKLTPLCADETRTLHGF